MLLVYAVSGLLVYAILELPFWADMLIGTIFTLMDTVVASSSPETSRRDNLPNRLRHLLSGKSRANDGLANPRSCFRR